MCLRALAPTICLLCRRLRASTRRRRYRWSWDPCWLICSSACRRHYTSARRHRRRARNSLGSHRLTLLAKHTSPPGFLLRCIKAWLQHLRTRLAQALETTLSSLPSTLVRRVIGTPAMLRKWTACPRHVDGLPTKGKTYQAQSLARPSELREHTNTEYEEQANNTSARASYIVGPMSTRFRFSRRLCSPALLTIPDHGRVLMTLLLIISAHMVQLISMGDSYHLGTDPDMCEASGSCEPPCETSSIKNQNVVSYSEGSGESETAPLPEPSERE